MFVFIQTNRGRLSIICPDRPYLSVNFYKMIAVVSIKITICHSNPKSPQKSLTTLYARAARTTHYAAQCLRASAWENRKLDSLQPTRFDRRTDKTILGLAFTPTSRPFGSRSCSPSVSYVFLGISSARVWNDRYAFPPCTRGNNYYSASFAPPPRQ